MWEVIKRDFKERFWNFETLKGLYFVIAAPYIVFVEFMLEEFFYKAVVIVVCGYFIFVEGPRKILVNRPKQELKKKLLIESRIRAAENEAEKELELRGL